MKQKLQALQRLALRGRDTEWKRRTSKRRALELPPGAFDRAREALAQLEPMTGGKLYHFEGRVLVETSPYTGR